MTERSNYGYPPMNIFSAQQWNPNTQQYTEYYPQDTIYSRPHPHSSPQYYQSLSPQHTYTHPQSQPHPTRPISQPDMQQYIAPSASPPSHIMTAAPHYPQIPGYPNIQYPASPNRPFSCDMCALSFNRQHDLKRHRETHSGEKPFLCNGGCGKTFTRKDALKRHQVSNKQSLQSLRAHTHFSS